MPETKQIREIRVIAKVEGSDGLKDLTKSLGDVNKEVKNVSDSVTFLKRAILGWLTFESIKTIVGISDEMQNLGNRLKIVGKDGEDASKTMAGLLEVANNTKQSLSGTAEVYARLGSSLKAAGASSTELLSLTQSLINTFRVAGSTNTETVSTIIQLSQAFSRGKLQGQELRTVMLQNAELARELQAKFGPDLAKKAEAGLIKVTDVLQVLADNQAKVNEQAKKLTPTFEQSLTLALNKVQFAIFKANEQFDLSGKFAFIMAFAVEHLGTILADAGIVLLAWGATYIPTLITGLGNLKKAMITFSAANPLLLLITTLSILTVTLIMNWTEFTNAMKKSKGVFLDFAADLEEVTGKWKTALDEKLFSKDFVEKRKAEIKTTVASLRKAAQEARDSVTTPEKEKPLDVNKGLKDLIAKLKLLPQEAEKLRKIKDILGDINKEFISGKLTVEEYNQKIIEFDLMKLNREFSEGKKNIFQFKKELTELGVEDLNRQLNSGVVSLQQYKMAVNILKLDELESKFKAGKISLVEYNTELMKLSDQFLPSSALIVGTNSYIESVGTMSQEIAKGITSTFTALEDSLVDMMKTGKFNFDQFTHAILDDLMRIMVRAAIIRPIAQGILGSFGNTGGAGVNASEQDLGRSLPAAHGAAFDGSIRKFATGGIVTSPTGFGYGNNRRGLMGEKGPEAILPLRRGSGGDLGVAASITPVNINIINKTGADISQKETTGPNGEKMVEILIERKVNDGLASGKFDKAMNIRYGVRSRGA